MANKINQNVAKYGPTDQMSKQETVSESGSLHYYAPNKRKYQALIECHARENKGKRKNKSKMGRGEGRGRERETKLVQRLESQQKPK